MKTITGTVGAWITPHSGVTPRDIDAGDAALVGRLSYSRLDMASEGWVRAGEASITVAVEDSREIAVHQVAALRQRQKDNTAMTERENTEIERQIQSLLAITFTPA